MLSARTTEVLGRSAARFAAPFECAIHGTFLTTALADTVIARSIQDTVATPEEVLPGYVYCRKTLEFLHATASQSKVYSLLRFEWHR